MPHHTAEILWLRGGQDFLGNRYSRKHLLRFDGGLEVPGSSSPQVVPLPMSDAAAVDPEEAFVASLASCHMLWFLSIAAQRKFNGDRYFDAASGVMARNDQGKMAMTRVTLRPQVAFSGEQRPTHTDIEQMHHAGLERQPKGRPTLRCIALTNQSGGREITCYARRACRRRDAHRHVGRPGGDPSCRRGSDHAACHAFPCRWLGFRGFPF